MKLVENTYEHIYRAGTSIRRYPESDVVAFAAGLRKPSVSVDLGSGTGRNLIPLLAAAAPDGLVVATDLALSGLLVIDEWVQAIGGEDIPASGLPAAHRDALSEVDCQHRRTYRIRRHSQAHQMGPAVLRGMNEKSDFVYLTVLMVDMAQRLARDKSVDAIINRGNLSYLPPPLIPLAVSVSREMLKQEGRMLLSIKSTADSRFAASPQADGSAWRRRLTAGDQAGLEMEFFDEERADKLTSGLCVVSKHHLSSKCFNSGLILADWVFVVER